MAEDNKRSTRSQDPEEEKKRRRRLVLIPLHIVVIVGIAFLVGALVRAQHQISQITMIPTPVPVESLPQESVPLAGPTPTPTVSISGGVSTPTATVSASATATVTESTTATPAPPTSTPRPSGTPRPSTTPRPTSTATASPSTSTSPSTSPSESVEPTPEFTYSVSAKQGVAPAGYMIVTVVVNPAGDYTVTYDGQAMEFNGSKYYLTVPALEDGGYRSHVRVRKS